MRDHNNNHFDESNVEMRPAGNLDLIETSKEQYPPTDVENDDGVGGKGYVVQ